MLVPEYIERLAPKPLRDIALELWRRNGFSYVRANVDEWRRHRSCGNLSVMCFTAANEFIYRAREHHRALNAEMHNTRAFDIEQVVEEPLETRVKLGYDAPIHNTEALDAVRFRYY